MITALLLVALAFPLAPVRERWVVGLPRNSAAAMEIRSALERYPVAGRLPFAWAVDLSPEELAQVRSFSVRYLEKDQPLTVSKRQTADCFGEQWTLRPVDGFPPSATMDIESAWEVVTGDRSVRIAVVDDGVEAEHPELAGRVVGAVNLSDDGLPPGALSLRDDHGTQTAGIIGAARDGIGITGVCPDCALLSVRLLGDGGPDDLYQTSSFAAASAISWAVENGAAVINNSWGPPDGNPFSPNAPRSSYALPLALDDAIDFAVTEGRSGLGTVLVWSAGNGGEPIAYDAFARDPRVLAVGSIDFTGRRAVYSDWGSALDLMTPSSGESGDPAVFATDRLGALGDSARNDVACADADACSEVCLEDFTREFGGTSASAAHVAGIAGLIASRYPELTAAQIIESMLLSAIPVDGLGASGVPSPRYGYGRVDPAAALAEAGAALSGRTRFFDLCGNGEDDDGDGTVDEDCTACVADGPEICDDRDNDCDGFIDPGFTCAGSNRGLCAHCAATDECAEGFRCRPSETGPGTFCFPRCDNGETCPEGTRCRDGTCDWIPTATVEDCYAYSVLNAAIPPEDSTPPLGSDRGCATASGVLWLGLVRRRRRV